MYEPTGSAIDSWAVSPLSDTGLPSFEPLTRNWTEPSGGVPSDEETVAVKRTDRPRSVDAVAGVTTVAVVAWLTVSEAVVSAAGKVAA